MAHEEEAEQALCKVLAEAICNDGTTRDTARLYEAFRERGTVAWPNDFACAPKRSELDEPGYLKQIAPANRKATPCVPVIDIRVALLGQRGCGKSSLVNALRNVDKHQEGWAPVGCTDCTQEPKAYQFMEGVTLIDLPGFGTPT